MPRRPAPPSRREIEERRAAIEVEAIEARRTALMSEATSDIVRRAEVLTTLRDGARVTIKDLLTPHPTMPGRYTLKPLELLDDKIAWAIQSVKIHDTIDGQTIEVRLVDRVKIFEDLGKWLGLWVVGDTHQHQHVHLHNLQGVPDDQLVARLRALETEPTPKGKTT